MFVFSSEIHRCGGLQDSDAISGVLAPVNGSSKEGNESLPPVAMADASSSIAGDDDRRLRRWWQFRGACGVSSGSMDDGSKVRYGRWAFVEDEGTMSHFY